MRSRVVFIRKSKPASHNWFGFTSPSNFRPRPNYRAPKSEKSLKREEKPAEKFTTRGILCASVLQPETALDKSKREYLDQSQVVAKQNQRL